MFFFEIPTTAVYCYLTFLCIAFQAYRFWKLGFSRRLLLSATWQYALMAFLLAVAISIKTGLFDTIRLLSIGVFPGGISFLAVCTFFAVRKSDKLSAAVLSVLAITAAAISYDAFVIEPNMLESNRFRMSSAKLKKKLTVGILSDLQTDNIGAHEETALKRLLDEKPDLILLAGDYIQDNPSGSIESRNEQIAKLNAMLKHLHFSAPKGIYAVGGNVDDASWPVIFKGLPVQCFYRSGTIESDEFVITGLTLNDSYNLQIQTKQSDKFHIVLGHVPDFALGVDNADLCVSGHTHGGQVQIPGLGPLITFSVVPAKWAAGGLHDKQKCKILITRGVGMERADAPRLRFCCPPEIVMLELVPERSQQDRL